MMDYFGAAEGTAEAGADALEPWPARRGAPRAEVRLLTEPSLQSIHGILLFLFRHARPALRRDRHG
jgi:hypothetical protein